jgi:hypothetical protein
LNLDSTIEPFDIEITKDISSLSIDTKPFSGVIEDDEALSRCLSTDSAFFSEFHSNSKARERKTVAAK